MNEQESRSIMTLALMAAFADGMKDEREREAVKRVADAFGAEGGIDLPAPVMPGNPILTTITSMVFNRDTFTGRDVVTKADDSEDAARKRSSWMWRQFAPSIAIGSYHWDRGMNAMASAIGEPIDLKVAEYTGFGRDGLPVQPKWAAAQTFGIKVRPVDLDASEAISKGEQQRIIRDLEAEIRRTRRLLTKGAITQETADRQIDKQRTKIERLRDGLDINGNEKSQ